MKCKSWVMLVGAALVGCSSSPAIDYSGDVDSTAPPIAFPDEPTTLQPYQGIVAVHIDNEGGEADSNVQFGTTETGGMFCSWGAMMGNCCVTDQADHPAGTAVSAGTVAISNLGDGETETATFDGSDGWYDYGGTVLFDDGDHLQVAAAGDVVHAFTATALALPQLAGLPAAFANVNDETAGTVGISAEHDWQVAWTPADASDGAAIVDVSIQSMQAAIECRAADSDGELVVRRALLAGLGTDQVGNVTVYRASVGLAVVDNANVSFEVQQGQPLAANAQL